MNILEIGVLAIIILIAGLLFMPGMLKTWYFFYDKIIGRSEKNSHKN